MPPPKKSQSGLGKAIIRDRFKGNSRPRDNDTRLFTPDTADKDGKNMVSITQENDLDAFLHTAELAGTEFTAERLNVKIIDSQKSNPFLLTNDEEKIMLTRMREYRERLTVPRRPKWSKDTTPEELAAMENESFISWRRSLAVLEEDLNMVMTPYERNLEVWRQLWRVIERSQVLVQIVDARNPLFYLSHDLQKYVKEHDESKENVVLINKADYLSKWQRRAWADYFQSMPGVTFKFFSAVQSDEDAVGSQFESTDDEDVLDTAGLESFLTGFSSGDQSITVGLVGAPNVGKSSTINKLMGAKRVTVSSTPGKTKHFQTMVLNKQVTLCDCPGLVFPSFATTKADMVVNGVLPIDQLREIYGPCQLVANRIPRFFFNWIYGMELPPPEEGDNPDRPPTASEVLTTFAIARGFRRTGQGNADESRAARVILKDYVNGKLLYCTPPPDQDEAEFSANTYRSGGKKYLEAERAMANRSKSQLNQGENMDTAEDGQVPKVRMSDIPLTLEEERQGVGVARISGSTQSFSRVQLFPHQSGYQEQLAQSTSGGKKSHKQGKKRVKDRSWRA